jgi:hypothetical protein
MVVDSKPNKPKRPLSPAKYAACIANSKHATGPKTPEGKAIAARNATKSGFTCKAITFLPGEDEQEFHAQVARWARQLRAETDIEYAEVEEAVYAKWKQRRIRRAQGAAAHGRIEKIATDAENRVAEEVCTLIPQLPLAPGTVVPKLRSSSQGCAFLIQQFQLLQAWLATHSCFEVSQRRYFLQLLGRRPADLFVDPLVFEVDRLYLGAISGPGSFTAAGAANAFLLDRPDDMSEGEFARRLEPMVQNLPPIAEGHARLVRLVDQTIAELTERVELLGLREQRHRYLAAEMAPADVTHEGQLRERYDGMAGRQHHASLREVRALQADRRKYGAVDCDEWNEQENPEDPRETGERRDVAAPPEPAQNEATVPEVGEAEEEGEGPIDVTRPSAGEIRNPKLEIRNESEIRNSKSETSSPQVPILGSPEEMESIVGAYRAQIEQVVTRVEREFRTAGDSPASNPRESL